MRASDNVRIRRQFRSYEKPQDEICVGDRVYCAALPPQGNSRKLQLTWSGPVLVTEIINNALVKVQEYGVKNPRTYVAPCGVRLGLAVRAAYRSLLGAPQGFLVGSPLGSLRMLDECSEYTCMLTISSLY